MCQTNVKFCDVNWERIGREFDSSLQPVRLNSTHYGKAVVLQTVKQTPLSKTILMPRLNFTVL